MINYDLANLGVEIVAKIKIPILGSITIAKASGNLKQGVSLNVGYKGIASGVAPTVTCQKMHCYKLVTNTVPDHHLPMIFDKDPWLVSMDPGTCF